MVASFVVMQESTHPCRVAGDAVVEVSVVSQRKPVVDSPAGAPLDITGANFVAVHTNGDVAAAAVRI